MSGKNGNFVDKKFKKGDFDVNKISVSKEELYGTKTYYKIMHKASTND